MLGGLLGRWDGRRTSCFPVLVRSISPSGEFDTRSAIRSSADAWSQRGQSFEGPLVTSRSVDASLRRPDTLSRVGATAEQRSFARSAQPSYSFPRRRSEGTPPPPRPHIRHRRPAVSTRSGPRPGRATYRQRRRVGPKEDPPTALPTGRTPRAAHLSDRRPSGRSPTTARRAQHVPRRRQTEPPPTDPQPRPTARQRAATRTLFGRRRGSVSRRAAGRSRVEVDSVANIGAVSTGSVVVVGATA